MNEKEKDSQSNDHHPTIIGTEDQEIELRKPPNEKIVDYKIVTEEKEPES